MTQHPMVQRFVRPLRLAWLVCLLAGCEGLGKLTPPEPAPPPKSNADNDVLLVGTVGAETIAANPTPQALRGFGLVIGLNGKGSSDCPTVIRDYLIDFLSKQIGPQGEPDRKPRLSPGELIDSPDTAVVEVTGVVPAGARKGTRFDLHVKALPGTSTQSLEGGLLLPTQLRYFDRAASGEGLIAGSVLAEGGGPVYVNPFADTAGAAEASPRNGTVMGGGRATTAHPTRLTLVRPAYTLAQSIERRINERFGPKPRVAEALSQGYVELNTPPQYAREPKRFRELVAQLYIDNRPVVADQHLRALASSVAVQGADLERIAATWEAMGRNAVASIQAFYAHPDAALRFYAARTGLRLGDMTALPVVGATAAAGTHSLRLLAVRELSNSDSPQATLHLAPLLNDPDQEIRVAAYESLLQRSHPSIQSVTFRHILDRSQINFVLDVVDSAGPPLIYVRQTRLPRIAVFGSRMPITPPVFYSRPDDSITVHTVDGSADVRLFAKQRRLSEEIVMPPRVVDLISALGDLPLKDEAGRLRGVGLPYSRVVQMLTALTRDDAIPAHLELEQTSLTELLGPEVTPERPESERADAEPAPQENKKSE